MKHFPCLLACGLGFLFAAPALTAADSDASKSVYWSPDHSTEVRVVETGMDDPPGECRLVFRNRHGVLLYRRDYTSPDQNHGYSIDRAAWTPDSRFFVFSMESSGGHQPWHSPTHIYSRSRRRAYCLDAVIGAVTTPDFTLRRPDVLRTRVQNISHVNGPDDVAVTVHLERLLPRLVANADAVLLE